MSIRTKRLLLLIAFIAGILVVGYLLYVVFFRSEPQPTPGDTGTNTNNAETNGALPNVNNAEVDSNTAPDEEPDTGLPGVDDVASGGLTATDVLTPDINTADPVVTEDGNLQYYNPTDGHFYMVDNNGTIVQVSDEQFSNVNKVTWAPDGDLAILEFPDGANISYNLQTGQKVTLPKEYQDFDFAPGSDKIAFKHLADEEEKNVLAISSPDGSSARTLEALGTNADNVYVDWSPTGRVAASYTEFVDANRQEIGFVGLNKENFKGVVVDGYGLESSYSKDGKNLLYSTFSEDTQYKPTVSIVNADGEDIGKNRQELKLNTFAHKCSFSPDSTKVYCGVPKDQKYGYGLEPSLLSGVTDDIYEVDLSSGIQKRLATPVNSQGTPSYSVGQMFTSTDGSYIYFRDEQSGQLIKIDIP